MRNAIKNYWSVTNEKRIDVSALVGTNLEEHLSGVLAAEIAREIDKKIVETLMIDVLIGEGWVDSKIKAPYRDWYIETAAWIHLNAVGDYKLLSGRGCRIQTTEKEVRTMK